MNNNLFHIKLIAEEDVILCLLIRLVFFRLNNLKYAYRSVHLRVTCYF